MDGYRGMAQGWGAAMDRFADRIAEKRGYCSYLLRTWRESRETTYIEVMIRHKGTQADPIADYYALTRDDADAFPVSAVAFIPALAGHPMTFAVAQGPHAVDIRSRQQVGALGSPRIGEP
jgi:hypothetical protein